MATMRSVLSGTTILLTTLFLGAGCERRTHPDDELGTSPREPLPPGGPMAERTPPEVEAARQRKAEGDPPRPAIDRSAVSAITAARCDREQRCDQVGIDKKYESRDACVRQVQGDWQRELSTMECPKGIVQAKLDECLDQIRTEGCANPIEALSRMASCRQLEVCRTELSQAR